MIESKNTPPEEENSPCTLLYVANDAEAADIITALAAYGIQATAVGGFISGLAIRHSDVQVMVRNSDFDEAKLALAEIQSNKDPVDWDSVDVGEPEE
jgi:hypothetical protein